MGPHHIAFEAFQSTLVAKGKQKATIASYGSDVKAFFIYLDALKMSLQEVDLALVRTYLHHLQFDQRLRGNSLRRKIISLKLFFRTLMDKGLIRFNPLESLPIPEREELSILTKPLEKIIQVLEHPPKASKLKDSRDLAILSLLCLEGIKVSELIQIQRSDLLLAAKESTLLIGGERRRILTLNLLTRNHLAAYLDHWDAIPAPKNLIVGFKGREASLILPSVSRHGIKHMLYEWGKKLQIHHLNSEQARHLAIDFQVQMGKSPESIMAHFGLRSLGNIKKHLRKTPHAESR